MKKKVGAYLDVQNIYYTVKQQHNSHFNYKVFMDQFLKKENLLFAKAFATNKNDEKQKHFQSLLVHFGYQLKLLDYILRKDHSAKADWDVGIALEMIEDAPQLDRLILVSGDGDFSQVIKKLKSAADIEVIVFGVQGLTAQKLIQEADQYCPIEASLMMPIPQSW